MGFSHPKVTTFFSFPYYYYAIKSSLFLICSCRKPSFPFVSSRNDNLHNFLFSPKCHKQCPSKCVVSETLFLFGTGGGDSSKRLIWIIWVEYTSEARKNFFLKFSIDASFWFFRQLKIFVSFIWRRDIHQKNKGEKINKYFDSINRAHHATIIPIVTENVNTIPRLETFMWVNKIAHSSSTPVQFLVEVSIGARFRSNILYILFK